MSIIKSVLMKKIIFISSQLFFLCLINAQQLTLLHTIQYSDYTFSNVLTSDKAGNIFVSGQYRGLNNDAIKGVYIHKYSASDNLVWKDTVSGASMAGLAVDPNGNAYFSRGGPVNFGNQLPGVNHLIKYDSLGQIQWAINSPPCFNLVLDNSSSVFVASNNIYKYNGSGNCEATIGISNSGKMLMDAAGNFFIVTGSNIDKHGPNGNLIWTQPAMFDSRITIDAIGNSYLSETGNFFSSPLTKFEPGGNIAWSINLPFYGAYALCTDSNNHIYVTGIYGSEQGIDGVEVRKINSTGNTLWSYKLPGSEAIRPTAIFELNGALYMSANRAFDYDAALYKINPPDDIVNNISETKKLKGNLSLSPNPSRGLFAISFINNKILNFVNFDIYDITGKCVYNKFFEKSPAEFYEIVDLSDFPPGIYSVEASTDKYFETKRLVVE
jgi:hypothetical protein